MIKARYSFMVKFGWPTMVFIFLIFCFSFDCYSQLDIIKEESQVFVGSDSIEGKKIVSRVYLTSIDSLQLKVEIDILDDWKQKENIIDSVFLDTNSILGNNAIIKFTYDTIPAYRFTNIKGLEILIAKTDYDVLEENILSYGVLLEIQLPKNRKYYVKTLPLMYEK